MKPEPHELPLLTVTEVARRYHIDQGTLMRWIEAGVVREHRTLLGQRRFRENEVQDALAADEVEANRDRERRREVDTAYDRHVTFLDWLIALDEPGSRERQRVTLDLIVRRARWARFGDEKGEMS